MKWLTVSIFVLAVLALPIVGQAQETVDTTAIDAYIENHMAEHQIPGVALCIVHNEEIVYMQGYGEADPDGTPVTAQTPFIIASTSKSFTALAVMQLVEAGQIDLDALVQDYLPWFTLADPEQAQQITVRHLLTHTSGFSYLDGDRGILNRDTSDEALEAKVREMANSSLNRSVGDSYEYSNINYATLGVIIQTVTGQSYEDYIEEHIFAPLEMTNSYTSETEAEANGLAVGHIYWFGRPRVSADAPYSRSLIPAGFLISSAEDMGHFLIAQLNGGRYGNVQILSPENVALMHEPYAEYGNDGLAYAFGWRTNLVEGEPSVWHGGDTSNYHANLAFLPTQGWGVAIVMNINGIAQVATLNEPINEVLRLASGYDTGHAQENQSGVFIVIVGILFLVVGLNLAVWGIFYWRRWRNNRPLRFVWHLLLPLVFDALQLWIILVRLPALFESTWSIMLVFGPDISLMFLSGAAVVVFTILVRFGVYLGLVQRARVSNN